MSESIRAWLGGNDMKWFSKLRIGAKLGGSFGVVLVLMVLVALIAGQAFNSVSHGLQIQQKSGVEANKHMGRFSTTMMTVRKDWYRGLLAKDNTELQKVTDDVEKGITKALGHLDELKSTLVRETDKTLYTELRQNLDQYLSLVQPIKDNFRKGDKEAAKPFFPPAAKHYADNVMPRIDGLVDSIDKYAAEVHATALANASAAQKNLTILATLALTIGVVVAAILSRGIKQRQYCRCDDAFLEPN